MNTGRHCEESPPKLPRHASDLAVEPPQALEGRHSLRPAVWRKVVFSRGNPLQVRDEVLVLEHRPLGLPKNGGQALPLRPQEQGSISAPLYNFVETAELWIRKPHVLRRNGHGQTLAAKQRAGWLVHERDRSGHARASLGHRRCLRPIAEATTPAMLTVAWLDLGERAARGAGGAWLLDAYE
jgi:hypothetical protein